MKVQQAQKLSAYKSADVKALVSAKPIAKRCRLCKKINLSCNCLKTSPLLNRWEKSLVVVAKSWLLGWLSDEMEDVDTDADSDADTVILSASSSEEESEAEESFVFPEVGDRERFEDSTLVSDEEGDEDLDTAFVEKEMEGNESEDSGNELPSFASLVEVLRSNIGN